MCVFFLYVSCEVFNRCFGTHMQVAAFKSRIAHERMFN